MAAKCWAGEGVIYCEMYASMRRDEKCIERGHPINTENSGNIGQQCTQDYAKAIGEGKGRGGEGREKCQSRARLRSAPPSIESSASPSSSMPRTYNTLLHLHTGVCETCWEGKICKCGETVKVNRRHTQRLCHTAKQVQMVFDAHSFLGTSLQTYPEAGEGFKIFLG